MKERLTGAIILVALIVLLVPELLTGPFRTQPAAARPNAGAEEAPLRSVTINLGDDARGSGAALPPPPADTAPPPPAPAPAPATDSVPTANPPAAAPAASAPAKPQPAAVSAAASGGGAGWFVQLGSFASRANAERLAQQVRGRGFPAGVSRAGSGRQLYRVRVGPVRERSAAVQLQARLRAAGHGGSIVPK